MLGARVIPCLLVRNGGLVKTVRFKDPTYVGDPINAVKIFNDKEVDELLILDVVASKERRPPNFELLARITREAFMPVGYGGGVAGVETARRLLGLGVEKVVINSRALEDLDFVRTAAAVCGSQSVVVSIDVKKNLFGRYRLYSHAGRSLPASEPVEFARAVERAGAGEILLNSVDRDGTLAGYDLELIRLVSAAVEIPVVAAGGAGSTRDLAAAVRRGGASAVAAGSFFLFHGPHRAVLITYPARDELERAFRE